MREFSKERESARENLAKFILSKREAQQADNDNVEFTVKERLRLLREFNIEFIFQQNLTDFNLPNEFWFALARKFHRLPEEQRHRGFYEDTERNQPMNAIEHAMKNSKFKRWDGGPLCKSTFGTWSKWVFESGLLSAVAKYLHEVPPEPTRRVSKLQKVVGLFAAPRPGEALGPSSPMSLSDENLSDGDLSDLE